MWLRRKVRSARRSSENRNKQFLYDLAGAISAQAPSSKQVTRTASGGNRADDVFLSEDQKGDERRTDAGDGEQKAAQKRNEGSFKRRGRCCSTFSRREAVSCFCFFLLLSAKSLGQNKQRPQRHAPTNPKSLIHVEPTITRPAGTFWYPSLPATLQPRHHCIRTLSLLHAAKHHHTHAAEPHI